jgi:S1-C subfamily serine protease
MGAQQQGQGQIQIVPSGPSTQQGRTTQQTPSTEQAPSVRQGYLGVGLETVNAALQAQYGLSISSGASVTALDGSGLAVQAGIRQGDVITAIGGATVRQQEDVVSVITQKKAGDSVSG